MCVCAGGVECSVRKQCVTCCFWALIGMRVRIPGKMSHTQFRLRVVVELSSFPCTWGCLRSVALVFTVKYECTKRLFRNA